MYHLPKGKTWDALLFVEALQKRGVDVTLVVDRVALTLPVQRMDIERIMNATAMNLRIAIGPVLGAFEGIGPTT